MYIYINSKYKKIILQKIKNFRFKKKKVETKRKEKKNKPINKVVNYHFVIGSSNFLLRNEPLEEILRERAQFFKREKKPITFWLVKSPKFLKSIQLSSIRSELLDAQLLDVELTAVVSLDKSFITWLKLRLQNVGQSSFRLSEDIYSPLASGF